MDFSRKNGAEGGFFSRKNEAEGGVFCRYKNLFGVPKQGVHSIRIWDIAVMDVLQTILGAFLISYFTGVNVWLTLLTLFILGIFLHKLFCVETTVGKWVNKVFP